MVFKLVNSLRSFTKSDSVLREAIFVAFSNFTTEDNYTIVERHLLDQFVNFNCIYSLKHLSGSFDNEKFFFSESMLIFFTQLVQPFSKNVLGFVVEKEFLFVFLAISVFKNTHQKGNSLFSRV
jgi:hypothetical protein